MERVNQKDWDASAYDRLLFERALRAGVKGDIMICPVCRREVFLQGGGGGWLHRKPPDIHHDIGTPTVGIEATEITELSLGTGPVIGSLDQAPNWPNDNLSTMASKRRHDLIQEIVKIGLTFADEKDPKNHCQCPECQERCERCKELTHD